MLTEDIPVDNSEVYRVYLKSNAFKELFTPTGRATNFDRRFHTLNDRFDAMSEEDMIQLIWQEHPPRGVRFSSLDWWKGWRSFEDMGPWAGMSGLPPELTTGSVAETAELYDQFPQRNKDIIDGIKREQSFVTNMCPPILIPGGMERHYWHGNDIENYAVFRHDVDTGNSIAVALASGLKRAMVYIGTYEGNLADLHAEERRVDPWSNTQ